MAKQLSAMTKMANEYGGTVYITTVALATTGIEQLTTLAVYRCPCVSVAQLSCNATRGCSQLLNLGYGLSFILAPAVVLYLLCIASSPKLWKMMTGCGVMNRKKLPERRMYVFTIMEVVGSSSISPFTWIAIALLDGRFLACALTTLPYDVERTGASFASCEAVATAKIVYTSSAYQDNRSFSQLIGWLVTTVFVLLAYIAFSYTRCTSPLTYYHTKYYKFYSASEEDQFHVEMKQKAQKDAEQNVRKFVEERRSKEEWDKISTVYEFHRDMHNLALYSNLHQWILEEQARIKEEEALHEEEEEGKDKEEDIHDTTAV